MGPTGASRILQIHPTLRCNLRCLHCYSSSGPEERTELPPALLGEAIAAARREGYTVVSVSGGEPLLYRPLVQVLEQAHACGALTTVTTNGMLLTARRLRELGGRLDLLAISLDGPPVSHNRMRASVHAFPQMAARLAGVRDSGIPFGFIFTLTQRNVHELDWVAGFAAEQGASLLQIHPLEEVGRARKLLAGDRPDELESGYAFLEAARLRKVYGEQLTIQLDLVHGDLLRSSPERAYADDADPGAPLAELVSPLVIEATGLIVPLEFGFARAFALGNVREAPLDQLADRWRRERFPAFAAICRRAFEEVTAPADLPIANWYEVVADRAEQAVPV
jgi:MoaA/NifB/PqqE/SkfB family radical SAM enzyme